MYNLIVTGNQESWMGAPFEVEKDRCVHAGEFTAEILVQKYGMLDDAACAELQALPALFAYETGMMGGGALRLPTNARRLRPLHGVGA